jgi:hypothetical protein
MRSARTFGALKLTLHAHGCDWRFIQATGKTFTGSGGNPLTS